MNYIIITNNPLVQSSYPSEHIITAKNYLDVLITARDHIHQGVKLLSHPQAGSVKPYETPYRSIILSTETANLDFNSLHYIENAIERFTSLSSMAKIKTYNQRVLEDFQIVDADLITNAINSRY